MEQENQKTTEKVAYTGSIPNSPIRYLLHISKPHTRWAVGAFFAVTIAQVVGTAVPYIFKSIIDAAQAVTQKTGTTETVWFWVILYPVSVAIMFAAWRISGFVGMQWVTRLNASSYTTLFKHLSSHSHTYFSNRFAGSLSSKVSHASEGTQSLAEAFLWNYYPTIISFFLTAGLIATSSGYAAIIFITLLVILIPTNILLARYRRPHVVQFSAQATKARGNAVDAITNIAAVRQFSRYESEFKRFGQEIQSMRLLNLKQWRISEWGLTTNNVIIVCFEALVLAVTLTTWTQGKMTIGELVMVLTLMVNVQGSLVFIGSSMNGFIRRYGEIEEGLQDILIEHDIVDTPEAEVLTVTDGEITWSGVNFAFGTNIVFQDFHLTIKPHERVGIVGSSGAGKTTFVSLLLRQHELEHGEILIDGQNIATVTQESLRTHVAVVPQEPMLFHRSIRENIAYGKLDATDAEIADVAKKAQAHDFVTSLPEAYETLVGERGVKLSGGQKQRIAIARAMLKNAPILVLDEATSALDSESEVAIQKALHELMVGKTVIAIAHRLSTLREMDRIIVLEKGKIVEDGTHGALIEQNGIYARLWAHQAGGFLQE